MPKKINNLTYKKGASSVTEKDIAEAITACKGIYVSCVLWLKREKGKSITRQTLAKRIKKSPRLSAMYAEQEEEILDLAEGQLLKMLKEGDRTAILFYLKCKGKARGYTERQEITGKDGIALNPPEINIQFLEEDGETP